MIYTSYLLIILNTFWSLKMKNKVNLNLSSVESDNYTAILLSLLYGGKRDY